MRTVIFRGLLYRVGFFALVIGGDTFAQEAPITSTDDLVGRLLHGNLSNGSNGSPNASENPENSGVVINIPTVSDEALEAHRKALEEVRKMAREMPAIVIPNSVSEQQ